MGIVSLDAVIVAKVETMTSLAAVQATMATPIFQS